MPRSWKRVWRMHSASSGHSSSASKNSNVVFVTSAEPCPPAAYTASRAGTVPPMPPSVQPTEAQRTDGDAFAAVLHQSILREQMRSTAPAAMPAAPHPQQAMQPAMQVQPQAVPLRLRHLYRSHLRRCRSRRRFPHHGKRTVCRRKRCSSPRRKMSPSTRHAPSCAPDAPEQVARETGVEIGALR